jgi:hypothetical protein
VSLTSFPNRKGAAHGLETHIFGLPTTIPARYAVLAKKIECVPEG